jgi:threonine dehydrogenase-like Zn-dependent dehydrogenase
MVEPTACAVHAARVTTDSVAVIGAGTLGLCTVAALRALGTPHVVIAAAKHPHQQRLARELGADVVIEPEALARVVRRAVPGALVAGDQLTDGVETVIDCVGTDASIAQALQVVAPGGTIVLVGMPGRVGLDLTPLWHREVSLRGAYAYTSDDFAKAFELVQDAGLERLVSATYPLDRWREAIDHAAAAGARGAVKIAFDLRNERGR